MRSKRNKYNARKTRVDGIVFDSDREAKRYRELKLLEGAGEISNLELQPKFPLAVDGRPVLMRSTGYPNGRRVKYVADFAYWDHKIEARVVEDVKGFKTDKYKLKKAFVEAMYPAVRIVEV